MSSDLIFPKRTIHLDFHTGPQIPGIGSEFDSEEFAQTFKRAHVDSVTVFATGHHGHAYWDTDRPERHPGMAPGFDLLKSQIDALHNVGIRAPIYLTVRCNEFCANEHPEWVAIGPDGRKVKWGDPLGAGWQIMDMSSPYRDYVAEQLQEILDRFAPVDGIFMDMCWDEPGISKWAIKGMEELGMDPRRDLDRRTYARHEVHQFMGRYRDMIEKAHKNHPPAGVWFNSRPKENLFEEQKFLRHIEVEALPTGGWGYAFFPFVGRFVRTIGLPTLSHTGRFYKSWGDNGGLKPLAALKYECCTILSMNMTNGVGDLLPPNGRPHKAAYDLIGEVYEHIEKCEPYTENGVIVAEVALITPLEGSIKESKGGEAAGQSGPATEDLGATRALMQSRQQFDILPMTADFSQYRLLVIPSHVKISIDFAARLRTYMNKGGKVIMTLESCLDENNEMMIPGVDVEIEGLSPYTNVFMHPEKEIRENIADFGYASYEKSYRMKAGKTSSRLIQVGEPYFERAYNHFSGHSYTPEGALTEYAGAIKSGNLILFALPIFRAFGLHANPTYKQIIKNCIDLLIPDPIIKDQGPSVMETTVLDKEDSRVVHVLSFSAERRADEKFKHGKMDVVEDFFPLVETPISIRFDRKPERVFTVPADQDLSFDYTDGYVNTKLTLLEGHTLIVVE